MNIIIHKQPQLPSLSPRTRYWAVQYVCVCVCVCVWGGKLYKTNLSNQAFLMPVMPHTHAAKNAPNTSTWLYTQLDLPDVLLCCYCLFVCVCVTCWAQQCACGLPPSAYNGSYQMGLLPDRWIWRLQSFLSPGIRTRHTHTEKQTQALARRQKVNWVSCLTPVLISERLEKDEGVYSHLTPEARTETGVTISPNIQPPVIISLKFYTWYICDNKMMTSYPHVLRKVLRCTITNRWAQIINWGWSFL